MTNIYKKKYRKIQKKKFLFHHVCLSIEILLKHKILKNVFKGFFFFSLNIHMYECNVTNVCEEKYQMLYNLAKKKKKTPLHSLQTLDWDNAWLTLILIISHSLQLGYIHILLYTLHKFCKTPLSQALDNSIITCLYPLECLYVNIASIIKPLMH